MSTSRSPSNSNCTADLGAQYISATPEYMARHKRVYEDLLGAELIVPLTCKLEGGRTYTEGTQHFVSPRGISSVVRHFIDKAPGILTEKEHYLDNLSIQDNKWEAHTIQGKTQAFDGVIITIPVPQLLQLKGTIQQLITSQETLLKNLQNVEYSSRFALGMFYDKETVINLPWDVKYFYENPCIRFVSVDNKKRNACESSPAVVAHSSVPFGIQHLEDDEEKVAAVMMKYLQELVPALPKPSYIKSTKWTYSQVHKPYLESPGCVVLHRDPLLILAGDAFTHSNFDGCIASSAAVVDTVVTHLQQKAMI